MKPAVPYSIFHSVAGVGVLISVQPRSADNKVTFVITWSDGSIQDGICSTVTSSIYKRLPSTPLPGIWKAIYTLSVCALMFIIFST